MEKQLFFGQDNYSVLLSDVDFSRRMYGSAILNKLQESSAQHNDRLGVGDLMLSEKGLAWSLNRIIIEVANLPRLGDAIMVKTWPKAMDSVNLYRDFLLLDTGNEDMIMAKATAAYALLDNGARRPQSIEAYISSIPIVTSENAIESRPEKIEALPCAWNYSKGVVRYGDIDLNGYVKSTKYLEWILDSYSWEHHQKNVVEKIELNFLSDAVCEEGYVVNMASKGKGLFLNNIVRDEDQKELVRAKIYWAKR